jgi:hypothetical protein
MDGQTVEGEIAAQDDLNIWLTIDGAPHLISRNQIRYIKGGPQQQIAPEETEAAPPPAAPSTAETTPGTFKAEEAPAQFVEEVEFPLPDEGGTLVIPPGLAKPPSEVEQTNVHAPLLKEIAEVDSTMVLSAEAELALETTIEETLLEEVGPADTGETELLPALDLDEDATFVLSQKDDEEISAHLICTTGPHAGEVIKLRPGITTIGRSSDNALPLSKDKEVSRRHALIAYEASKFVLQDQNSLNGTFVNDQLVKEPRPLQDGDILLIGISTLKFQERSKK